MKPLETMVALAKTLSAKVDVVSKAVEAGSHLTFLTHATPSPQGSPPLSQDSHPVNGGDFFEKLIEAGRNCSLKERTPQDEYSKFFLFHCHLRSSRNLALTAHCYF